MGDDKDVMNINIVSFGFKHGIPNDADFVLDVRCLPNPYWVESMREKTISLLDFLNPLYIKEGKSQIVIAIGCTGGNHRSVAIAEALKKHFVRHWDNVSVNHRDINRK